MTKDLSVGLVGAGRIGADHARTISTLKGVKEIVVADVEQERAEAVAADLGDIARVSTPEAIVGEVDALVITTPTVQHATHLIAAAEAGVPVFCEKPVALDIETTKKVLEKVNETGNPTQIGFQRRFDEGYINAKKLLAEGRVGTTTAHVLIGLSALLIPDGNPIKPVFILIFVVMFVFIMQGTQGPLCWLILSEIFPLKFRGLGYGIAAFMGWMTNFMVSGSFPTVVERAGVSNTYFLFAGLGVLALIFVYRWLPETRGKSLEELESEFMSKG